MDDYAEVEIFRNETFRVMHCQRRGFDPYYELQKKKKFLFLSWWSMEAIKHKKSDIFDIIDKWNAWPPKLGKRND